MGKPAYYIGLFKLTPMLTAFTLKLIPNNIAKKKLISHHFKGWDADHFQRIADKYSMEEMDGIIRPKAMEKIRWHQQKGHKVVIVSASMECWLNAWCDKNNIALISTRLEIKDNKLTGKFATNNSTDVSHRLCRCDANRLRRSWE